MLKKGVESNKVICPISATIVKEVLKQSDVESLRHTAKIIDTLSQGIVIRHESERFTLELYNFFYNHLGIKTDVELSKNFFSFLMLSLYGTQIPTNHSLSLDGNFVIQKIYIDKIKEYTLLDFIDKMGIEKLDIYRKSKVNTDWYDMNKQKHISEFDTLHQLYMNEISGPLEDVFKKDIEEVFRKVLHTKAKLENITFEEEIQSIEVQKILNLIYHSFNEKKMDTYLPTLDIGAMLHAKIRWNKTQKYKQGDIDDIRHAVTALPYYEYFFTERRLHSMIKECKYNEKYNCNVMWKTDEILDNLDLIIE